MQFNKRGTVWGFVIVVILLVVVVGSWEYFSSGSSEFFDMEMSRGSGAGYNQTAPSAPMTDSAKLVSEDGSTYMMGGADEDVVSEDRMVVKNGSLDVVVEDLGLSLEGIGSYAKAKGGWVVSSGLNNHETNPTAHITVRIPSNLFDEAMSHYRSLAEKVTNEYSQGEDVTKQYTDLNSRLTNLEASRDQLLKLMERTGEVKDILSVQRELSNVSSQIELLKGQLQYLETSVAMSSISVSLALSEDLLPVPPGETWRPGYVLKNAWKGLLGTLKGLSYLVIRLVVFAIIWIPVLLIIWGVYRLIKKRLGGKKK